MQEALEVVKELNRKNLSASLDVLGENIKNSSDCYKFTQEYIQLLEQIEGQKLKSHVSVKLTMLGLDLDRDLCEHNITQILKAADAFRNRVAFDMEGTPYTDRTLDMYFKMAKMFKSPEIVLQAYLHRTPADLKKVLEIGGRFRLCKGAYKENSNVALQDMASIRKQYLSLIDLALTSGQRICIASHDDEVIKHCKQKIKAENIDKERYEFQMLYGMRKKTWEDIAKEGHNMTVYVPYGTDWQAYYSRRLMERKENVFFVVKNLFKS